MFVYFVYEQETSSNLHFYSFIRVAEMLNRTVVLINVQNSRLGACKKFPFSFYYNIEKLQNMFPQVQFITQDDFLQWTKERIKSPDVIFSSVQLSGNVNMAKTTFRNLNTFLRLNCLDKFNFNTSDYSSKIIFVGAKQNEKLSLRDYLISRLDFD